jgi:hypothetical protein
MSNAYSTDSTQAFLSEWERLTSKATRLLRSSELEGNWLHETTALVAEARHAVFCHPDMALFVALQSNALTVDHYSENHALTCLVLAELAGTWMEWSEPERAALACAALTMNISMTALQDDLAGQDDGLSTSQRQRVDHHAAQSVDVLRRAGVLDALWLGVVEHHHHTQVTNADSPADTVTRLSELLRRVDIYSAKLSRRINRDSVTPAKAARDACLGPAGHPDPIGVTLLRIAGLYPPGTYVQLANGDTAVVIRRGEKAHTPLVAAVRRANWSLISPPQQRDTSRPGWTVHCGVDPCHVRVNFDHIHLLCCS